MQIVIILLSQAVADERIECSPQTDTHGFSHLCIEASFETFYLLLFSVHMRRSITGQIIKLLQVFIHTFTALSEPHELRHFHGHQTWWDIGAAEYLGELRQVIGAFGGKVVRWWDHQIPAGPCS